MQTIQFTFDHWLADAEQSTPDNCPSAHQHTNAFQGNASFADALELARHGWKEGRERMARATADIVEAVGEDRETLTYDVAGNEPDVGRFLAGEPENMLAFLPTDEQKIITIVANICTSAAIGTDVIFVRGAAICRLIDRLELQGHRVELRLAIAVQKPRGDFFYFTTTVKAASDHLDIDRVAFALAHPASQRRIGFATYQLRGFSPSGVSVQDIPAEARGDIYMPSASLGDRRWTSAASAAAWINEQVCKFTIDTAAAE
jgi:hypothetical protein